MLYTKLHRFLLAQKWAVLGFIVSFLAVLGLTFNQLAEAIYFDDPLHQNVELRAWMTPRYITLSYKIPRPTVLELLEIKEGSDYPKRLDRLAENLGITLEELTIKVRAVAINDTETNND